MAVVRATLGESTVGVKAVLIARLLAAQPEHDPVVEVAAGYMHTLARTASGRIYSWGNGEEGRLGHGDEDDRVEPKEIVCWQNPEDPSADFLV